MRVYHFVPAIFGLENLRERRLKLARIAALNDPFELIGPSAPDPATRKAFADTKAQLASQVGLLGVCLGFDVPNGLLTPVTYVRKRPLPDMDLLRRKDDDAKAAMLKVLSTKFSHWRYEDEVRLFARLDTPDARGLYFRHFNADLQLREVIVGASSDLSRRDIRDALASTAAQVRKARLAFRSFKVVEQRKASLWP
ncbi:hypothetical protein LTR94_025274 [Friedmanniomyces endolithicus]|nr:hypothetical protein LTR94_025274 [Friedmanniomyces endolithicus]